ncbi:MAG: flagellar basal body-associated FliL family protein [Nitrospirota bacterium]
MAEEKPEEAAKEGEHGEGAPKKKGLPILWIIIGLLVVLLVGGAVYFLKFMKGPDDGKGKGNAHTEEKKGEHGEEEEPAEEEEHAEEEHAEEEEHGKEGEEHAEAGEHGEEAAGGHGEEGGGKKVKCPAPPAAGGHGAKVAVVSDTFNLDPFIVNLAGATEVKFLKVTVKLKLAKADCTRFVEPHVAEIRDSILMLLSSKEYEMINTVQGKMELRDEVLERVKNIVKEDRVKSAFFTDFVAQ